MAAMCGGWVMLGLFLVLLRALRLKHSTRPQSSTQGCTPAGPTGLIGLTGPAGLTYPQAAAFHSSVLQHGAPSPPPPTPHTPAGETNPG